MVASKAAACKGRDKNMITQNIEKSEVDKIIPMPVRMKLIPKKSIGTPIVIGGRVKARYTVSVVMFSCDIGGFLSIADFKVCVLDRTANAIYDSCRAEYENNPADYGTRYCP